MELFLNYSWPGNVRELENNVKRFIILGNESQLITEMQRKRETGQYSAIPDDSQSPAAEVVTTLPPPEHRTCSNEGTGAGRRRERGRAQRHGTFPQRRR